MRQHEPELDEDDHPDGKVASAMFANTMHHEALVRRFPAWTFYAR